MNLHRIIHIVILTMFFSIIILPSISMALDVKDLIPDATDIIGRRETDPQRKITLPAGRFREEIIPASITIMLSLAGSIAFIVFTVAGIMLIVSQGNEELHTKVKNIFIYAVIGLTLIALSYAIVYGIFTLQFQEGVT